MKDRTQIIAALEAGEVGWPLDGEAYLALFPNEGYQFQPHTDKIKVEGWLVDPSMGEVFQGYNRKIRVESFSTCINACAALCARHPDVIAWTVGDSIGGPNAKVVVMRETDAVEFEAQLFGSSKPAAALLAALLRATGGE